MDHAKFCTATQGWSTLELNQSDLLLRHVFQTKQEQDHGRVFHAMPLRGGRARKSVAG
jgi:hypothetical protein